MENSQATTINSVIEYEKEGGDPIEIKKTGDIITISGSVILLDEGASFGGSMLVRIPFGKGVPAEPEELSDKENEKLMYEALQDIVPKGTIVSVENKDGEIEKNYSWLEKKKYEIVKSQVWEL